MAFRFVASVAGGELRQGELLADVWVHRAAIPAARPGNVGPVVVPTHHPFVVVVHSDCDLLQDFNLRKAAREAGGEPNPSHKNAVPQVLLCEAYPSDELRQRIEGSDLWKRVRRNQDERYHYLDFEPLLAGDEPLVGAPTQALILDFRKVFMVHTEDLYAALEAGVLRLGVVPPVFVHDLMHRCFGYLSRVGVPE